MIIPFPPPYPKSPSREDRIHEFVDALTRKMVSHCLDHGTNFWNLKSFSDRLKSEMIHDSPLFDKRSLDKLLKNEDFMRNMMKTALNLSK